MFTDWLRRVTKWLIVPIATFFARLGISPNALTIVGSLLNIGVAAVIASGRLQLGGLLLILASGFDALDGSLARQLGKPTKFGAFLDSCMDRVSESAVLLGIAWWYMGQAGLSQELLAYVALFGATMVSYTRARAEGIGVECKGGLFTRVERAILIIAGLVTGLVTPMLWILAVGTVGTAIYRMVSVYRASRNQSL